MVSEIMIKPIGIIHTSFQSIDDNIPIQGKLKPESIGSVEVFPEFREGLKDIEGFSHIILLYYFHKSPVVKLIAKPYMDNEKRGVFSIRSPHRPNHIGLTLVELLEVKDTILKIKGADMLDYTPLLDIKPYNPFFDGEKNARIGWMTKFFWNKDPADIVVSNIKEWLHE